MPKGPDDWEKFEAAQQRKAEKKQLEKAFPPRSMAEQDAIEIARLRTKYAAELGVDESEVEVHLSRRGAHVYKNVG